MSTTTTSAPEIFYPAEDGEPLAETGIHIDAIFRLREFLEDMYAGRKDVFVGTDQFWYWEEGNPNARCAPDIMVCFGVKPIDGFRRSFFSWLENGSIPSFICEFSSEKTWRNDLGDKFDLFERLRVQEYFLFDPEALYLRPNLQGWRLKDGHYNRIPLNEDGSITSEVLRVRLIVEDTRLRLLSADTGEKILARVERLKKAELESETNAERLKKAELESETNAERLKKAELEAKAKDAEIARLKAQLSTLGKEPNGPGKI